MISFTWMELSALIAGILLLVGGVVFFTGTFKTVCLVFGVALMWFAVGYAWGRHDNM